MAKSEQCTRGFGEVGDSEQCTRSVGEVGDSEQCTRGVGEVGGRLDQEHEDFILTDFLIIFKPQNPPSKTPPQPRIPRTPRTQTKARRRQRTYRGTRRSREKQHLHRSGVISEEKRARRYGEENRDGG